jgi:hypothetical protein
LLVVVTFPFVEFYSFTVSLLLLVGCFWTPELLVCLFLDAGRFWVFASPTVKLKAISFLERSFAEERERERERE